MKPKELRQRFEAVYRLLPRAMVKERLAARRRIAQLQRGARGSQDPAGLVQEFNRLEQMLAQSACRRGKRAEGMPSLAFPENLPIMAKKDEIITAIRGHSVVIVSGDTGSGKSTQIPKFCLAAGRGIDGLIGHTQPRRIAAQAVARRIAEELGQVSARAVGYKIRFQDTTPPEAYVKVMTDGILLAEAAGDRMLAAYDTLIVDEAHERSLNIDFILGYLRTLTTRRRDLRVVITSATIDTAKFAQAFDNAPVIEVSGRMFPVEVRYDPTAQAGGESEPTPVEQAAAAVRRIEQERRPGDILVFMPTEQDIREASEMIRAASPTGTLVLPLFARLTAAEQGRVFHPAGGRKIIVATNVAETSLTIPGITFVVDTGLARIPQYSPRTRTTAMPVAPISRSSADQRKGRCGRVANGVCIRLYSEEDYLGRALYTPPEILRANLAEVILRMMALRLGEVAEFPFIDPPDHRSIADGFRLLVELGAIQQGGRGKEEGGKVGKNLRLTAIGRMMARIPLDPRLSRMLIEARTEGCVEPIAVIAAALSIQDPRERPADKTVEADQAHGAFNQPHSDFLTLLAIWNRFRQARQEMKSAGQMRNFCRQHFLSFKRMREWEDVFRQIMETVKEAGSRNAECGNTAIPPRPLSPPNFGKLHRCILSGLLANIALKKEKNLYRTTKDREAMIFPGSGLFNAAGDWIVAAEMVETSRLFARTVASIDPTWLESLGGDLCRFTYRDPRWDPKRGEVVATEQVSLFGLVIVPGRTVSYSPIKPDEAVEIFIREALVAGALGKPFGFLRHNQRQAAKVAALEDRLRRRDLLVGDEHLVSFYRKRLPHVYDTRTLGERIKAEGGDRFLRMSEEDLMNYRPDESELGLFPECLKAAGHSLELRYRFEPGADSDGVTLQVPSALAAAVPPATVEWMVPGLLREKLEVLVKGLPKTIRKRLVPLNETVDFLFREMPRQRGPFLTALGEIIHKSFGVDIPASAWSGAVLPDHLKMRVAITAPDGRELASGRDPAILRSQPAAARIPPEVRQRWERAGITRWDFGDLPDALGSDPSETVPWVAYPALEPSEDGIRMRVFARRDRAQAAHPKGVAALLAVYFARDLKLLKRNLALPEELHPAARYFGGARRIEDAMTDRVVQDLFAVDIRSEKAFREQVEACRSKIIPTGRELLYAVIPVLQAYAAARGHVTRLSDVTGPPAIFGQALGGELTRLVPLNFITLYERARLGHLPRYIEALATRARRAALDLEKDFAKSREVQRFTEQLHSLLQGLSPEASAEKRRALEELHWAIEEYKVSVYAQELKTAIPVSPKRLREKIKEIERMV
ncbi:MAG: ATP-dependent RNA helicase HrpA [Hyphomicrobiales bacterium]